MIQLNNHIHTNFSKDGKSPMQEVIAAARKAGLKIITITDHFPLPEGFTYQAGDSYMAREQLNGYIKSITAEKEKNKDMDIRLGAEIDFRPGFEKLIPSQIKNIDFDYIIGGVHTIAGWNTKAGWDFDYSKEVWEKGLVKKDITKVYKEYFDLVRQLISSRLFDAVAHLDIIKKFNENSKYFDEDEEDYRKEVMECLDLIEKNNIILEINTSGLFRPCKALFPSEWVLKEAFKRKIEITIGSDCHKAEDISRGFDYAEKLLKKIGYKRLVAFKKRKKECINLGDEK